MNDVDELDRIWTDGLATAADAVVAAPEPARRVAGRVRSRRRSRRTLFAGALVVIAAVVIVGTSQLGRHGQAARVATIPPPVIQAVVQVDDAPGGALKIEFPGRQTSGTPPSIAVPSGLIRFEIHELAPGHELRIDGVPSFDVVVDSTSAIVTRDVRLAPGDYVMYCAIPGHRDAGEKALLEVATPEG